ncbi:MAG TPA: MFS transporter [Dongiaceae bacterium]|nr:MFS transporter [Dongiaceae bacterium]
MAVLWLLVAYGSKRRPAPPAPILEWHYTFHMKKENIPMAASKGSIAVTLTTIGILFFVLGLLGTVTGTVLPNLKQEFGLSNENASFVYLYWSLGFFCGAYAGGRFFKIFGIKRLLIAILLISIALLFSLYSATSIAAYKYSISLLAVMVGALFTAGHGIVGSMASANRTSNLSLMDFVVSMGYFSSPLLINGMDFLKGPLSGNWRMIFLLAGALLLIVILLSLAADIGGREQGYSKEQGRANARYIFLLTKPIFISFAIASIFLHAAEWGHNVWFVTYAHEVKGLSTSYARTGFSFFLIGTAFSRLINSWLARAFQPAALLAFYLAIAVAGVLSILVSHSYVFLSLSNLAFGFGLGALFPIILGLSMNAAPAHGSMLSAIALMSGTIGAQGASYLIGHFADRISLDGSYRCVAFAMIAFFFWASAFLYFYVKFPKPITGISDRASEVKI